MRSIAFIALGVPAGRAEPTRWMAWARMGFWRLSDLARASDPVEASSCLRPQTLCRNPPISGTSVAQGGRDREVRPRVHVPLRRVGRGGILPS